jgi:2-methylcitrate dehydratase
MGITTSRIAEYAHNFNYDNLPESTIHAAKRALLNTLACVIPGFYGDSSKIIRKTIAEVGGRPECTIIGTSIKTSCENAALINGSASHYWDSRDFYGGPFDTCHPGDNIPPALALCERQKAPGRALLAAIVLGIEIQCRLMDHAGIRRYGFDSNSTSAAYTIPVMAGPLMGLSSEQIRHAIGVSGALSNTLTVARFGGEVSMLKVPAFHLIGRQAIFASIMAKNGFTGPEKLFEGENGYFRAISGGEFDIPKFGGEEGEGYKIHQVVQKQFSVGFLAQSAVRAGLELVEQHDIKPDEIEKILVNTISIGVKIMGGSRVKWEATTTEAAQSSLPHCVAVAIHDREAIPRQFSVKRIMDPSVRALVKKTEVVVDSELDKLYPQKMPAEVIITLKNGKKVQKKYDYPLGHPMDPMSDEQLGDKFKSLSSPLLTPEQIETTIDLVMHIDELETIDPIFGAMEI